MAWKCIFQRTQLKHPGESLSSLDLSLLVHLQTPSITGSKCISEFTRSVGLQVHLQLRSIAASTWISEFTGSQSQSVSPNTLDYGLKVNVQGATTVGLRYRVMEVDRVTGSIYSAGPRVDRHLISISSYDTMDIHSVFASFWFHLLFPRFHGSTQSR